MKFPSSSRQLNVKFFNETQDLNPEVTQLLNDKVGIMSKILLIDKIHQRNIRKVHSKPH